MIEKRSFWLGFAMAELAEAINDPSGLHQTAALAFLCKKLNVTEVSMEEYKEIGEFVTYLNGIMDKLFPRK